MTAQGEDLFARFRIPEFDGLVKAPGGDARSVGAEPNAGHGPGMPVQGEYHFARRDIPDFDIAWLFIGPLGNGEALTVRAECQCVGPEIETVIRVRPKVAWKRFQQSARRGLPELYLIVSAGGREQIAVRAEQDGTDQNLMSLKAENLLA